jgi:ABC-type phosphate transport system ATPase subunit
VDRQHGRRVIPASATQPDYRSKFSHTNIAPGSTITDHVAVLNRSYIVEHGPTEAMFNDPQDPRTADYVHGRFG